MTKLDEALGLFPSCIKGGENWSPTCQVVLDAARQELSDMRSQLEKIKAAAWNAKLTDRGRIRAIQETFFPSSLTDEL